MKATANTVAAIGPPVLFMTLGSGSAQVPDMDQERRSISYDPVG